MDTEWASWFAGLCDGEATFVIEPFGTPRLRITLTATDRAVLEHVQSVLGGRLYHWSASKRRAEGRNDKDSVAWILSGRRDCAEAATLLQGRMKSKKAQEMEVWCAAIAASIALGPTRSAQRKNLMLPYRQKLLQLRS